MMISSDNERPGEPSTGDSVNEGSITELQAQIATLTARLSRYEFDLEEGPSQIEDGGCGLFTNSRIPSGSVVGEYIGTRTYRILIPATGRYVMWQRNETEEKKGEPQFLKQDTYVLWLVDDEEDSHPWQGHYPEIEMGIDGNVPGNMVRFANSDDEPNLEMFVTEDKRVMAISLREVEAGEELFWDYHPGREKDFSITPDHIETDLKRYITVTDKGWVRLTEAALEVPQKRGGKRRRRNRRHGRS